MQPLHLQQHGADHLGPLRHLDAHGVLHRGGVGDAVGEAADAAHPIGEEGHLVVAHAGLGQLLHATVDIEQPVVGVDDVLAVHEQPEVTRLVRGDVQRAHRHYAVGLVAQLVYEGVGLGVRGGHGALAVIHGVFAQRMDVFGPVIG
ncbi:hypothetical protein D3C80_1340340 [compost metagenome]